MNNLAKMRLSIVGLIFFLTLGVAFLASGREALAEDGIVRQGSGADSKSAPRSFLDSVTGDLSGESTVDVDDVNGEAAVQPDPDSAEGGIVRQEGGSIVAARAPLPGDNITPPSGVSTLVSELQSKFGVTPRNGSGRWDEPQLRAAYRVLSSLPEVFRKCTKRIQRDGGQGGVLGWVMLGDPTVHLESSCVSPGTFQGTLVHEMVHTFQADNNNIYQAFKNAFYPGGRRSGRSVSAYGNTQPIEDMAECGRAYWAKGPLMKQYYPGRYEFMKRYVFNNVEFQ